MDHFNENQLLITKLGLFGLNEDSVNRLMGSKWFWSLSNDDRKKAAKSMVVYQRLHYNCGMMSPDKWTFFISADSSKNQTSLRVGGWDDPLSLDLNAIIFRFEFKETKGLECRFLDLHKVAYKLHPTDERVDNYIQHTRFKEWRLEKEKERKKREELEDPDNLFGQKEDCARIRIYKKRKTLK